MKQNGTKHDTAVPAPPKPDPLAAAIERAVDRVRHMSHEERVQSLKDAGILTRAGKLSPAYR